MNGSLVPIRQNKPSLVPELKVVFIDFCTNTHNLPRESYTYSSINSTERNNISSQPYFEYQEIYNQSKKDSLWITENDNICFSPNYSSSRYSSNVSKFISNLNILNEIKSLPTNWNGNGAEPFSSHLIIKVTNLIKSLTYQPDIFPTGEKSIQLEFENAKGDYLEFEIFENNDVQKFFCDSTGKEETSMISIENINDELLKQFFTC